MALEVNRGLEPHTQALGDRFKWYLDQTKLPWTWFTRPDHTAVTAADISEFDYMVKDPKKELVILDAESEEKFSVAAKIAGTLNLGRLGNFRWVEIDEPTPEEQGAGLIGVKKLQFYCDELEKARYFLGVRGIPYEMLDFEDYAQINVVFDPEGNSFRLTNMPMDAVASERIRTGRGRVLKPIS